MKFFQTAWLLMKVPASVTSNEPTPPVFSPVPLNTLFFAGLRPGDEILVLNGRSVSGLDLTLIQTLFAEQTLHLTLRRDGPRPPAAACQQPAAPLRRQREVGGKHHRAKSSSGDEAPDSISCSSHICVHIWGLYPPSPPAGLKSRLKRNHFLSSSRPHDDFLKESCVCTQKK